MATRADIIEVGAPRKAAPVRYSIPAHITLSIDDAKAIKESSLYVINDVMAVEGQLGDISLTINRQGSDRVIQVRIRGTWVPQDLNRQAPRNDLLDDPQFIGLVEAKVLKIIDTASARKIAGTPQALEEWARVTLDRAAQAAADSIDIPDEAAKPLAPVVMSIPMGDDTANMTTALGGSAYATSATANQSMTMAAINNHRNGSIDIDQLCGIIKSYGETGVLTAKEAEDLQSTSLPGKVHRALEEVVRAKSAPKAPAKASDSPLMGGSKLASQAAKKLGTSIKPAIGSGVRSKA